MVIEPRCPGSELLDDSRIERQKEALKQVLTSQDIASNEKARRLIAVVDELPENDALVSKQGEMDRMIHTVSLRERIGLSLTVLQCFEDEGLFKQVANEARHSGNSNRVKTAYWLLDAFFGDAHSAESSQRQKATGSAQTTQGQGGLWIPLFDHFVETNGPVTRSEADQYIRLVDKLRMVFDWWYAPVKRGR